MLRATHRSFGRWNLALLLVLVLASWLVGAAMTWLLYRAGEAIVSAVIALFA